MKKIFSLFLILIFFSFSIPVEAKPYKRLSQLEIREIQTHVFPTSNTQEVLKATINTLQDEGFIIQNIEDNLGYIEAKREYRAKRTNKKNVTKYSLTIAYFLAVIALSPSSAASLGQPLFVSSMHLKNELSLKTVVVGANADVEPFGKQTKVRLTVVEKALYNADGFSYIKSSPCKVVRIYNPTFYQNFFSQLDKSIFYEEI